MKTSAFALCAVILFHLPVNAQQNEQQPSPPMSGAISLAGSNAALTKLDLTPDASGKLSQFQMQALLRVVADKDLENDKRLRNYTYTERDVENKLDGKGDTKSTDTRTLEILEI